MHCLYYGLVKLDQKAFFLSALPVNIAEKNLIFSRLDWVTLGIL